MMRTLHAPGSWSRLAIVAALVLMPARLNGVPQSQTLRLREYIHSIYQDHDGAPLGRVDGILQTPEGYLWVFTSDGLLRFDGLRFVRPATPCTAPIASHAPAIDGGFWAICGDKLIRRTPDARFVVVGAPLAGPLPPHSLFADRQGRVWILGPTIRFVRADGAAGRAFDEPRAPQFFTAAQDNEGTIWATEGSHIFHLYDDRIERVATLDAAYCLTPARAGGVLVAAGRSILRLRRGLEPALVAALPEGTIVRNAQGCMRDAVDGVWIARAGKGVALVRGGAMVLPRGVTEFDRMVTDIFVDREDLIWVGSTRELNLIRRTAVSYLPLPAETGDRRFVHLDSNANLWTGSTEGARRSDLKDSTEHFVTPRLDYRAIGEDEHGTIWLATPAAIGKVIGDRFVGVRDAAGRPVANVSAFRQNADGELWAIASGTGVYRLTPGPPRLIVPSTTASRPFLVSRRQGIWTTADGGAIEQRVDDRTTTFPNRYDQAGVTVTAMIEAGDSIWIASSAGLERFRGGKRTRWTRAQGLADGAVRQLVADRSGFLWVLAGNALLRLSRAELDASPDGEPRSVAPIRIDAIGGVVPLPANARNVPAPVSDRQGRLYGFNNPNTAVIITPDAFKEPSMAPASVIESVLVDGEPVDPAAATTFVDPARLEFEYTALNLRGAESTRFRYRLEGYDADWIDARILRTATYRNLRPGRYRFDVTAQGPEGIWNKAGTSFAFRVVPVFWRRWWFQLSVAGLGLALLGGLHRLRVRQLTRQFNLRLDARVGERTRIARELHDTLLQSFQGLMLQFQSARDLLPGSPAKAVDALDVALDRADRAIVEGRDAIQNLRGSVASSNELGQALAAVAEELTCHANGSADGPSFRLSIEGTPCELHPVVRDDVHRIAREAVHNAFRHAEATQIEAEVTYTRRELRVRIRDNGRGIDPQHVSGGRAKHWGLVNMRERADQIGAELEVWTDAGIGTEIELRVPAASAYTGRVRRGRARRKPGNTGSEA